MKSVAVYFYLQRRDPSMLLTVGSLLFSTIYGTCLLARLALFKGAHTHPTWSTWYSRCLMFRKDVQMVQKFSDYVVAEDRGVNILLWHYNQCALFSFPSEWELFQIIFLNGNRKDVIWQIKGHLDELELLCRHSPESTQFYMYQSGELVTVWWILLTIQPCLP